MKNIIQIYHLVSKSGKFRKYRICKVRLVQWTPMQDLELALVGCRNSEIDFR